jgi:hypothetical protein
MKEEKIQHGHPLFTKRKKKPRRHHANKDHGEGDTLAESEGACYKSGKEGKANDDDDDFDVGENSDGEDENGNWKLEDEEEFNREQVRN